MKGKFTSADPAFRLFSDGSNLVLEPPAPAEFLAKITGTFLDNAGLSCYTWVEMEPVENGAGYRVKQFGRTGDANGSWCREINGAVGVPTGTIVRLRLSSVTISGGALTPATTQYEFVTGSISVMSCVHVSSVQCTGGLLIVTYDTVCV